MWGFIQEEIASIPGKRGGYKVGLGAGSREQTKQINLPSQSLPSQMDGQFNLERWNTRR
jgi:hypothetical protein